MQALAEAYFGANCTPAIELTWLLLLGARRLEVYGCGTLQHAERTRLGQVKVYRVPVVTRVPDGHVLSNAELKVAAARGEHHRAVDFRRQQHWPVQEVVDALADRIAVLCRFVQPSVTARSKCQRVRTID